MDRPGLNDPEVFPDTTVLSRMLGPAKAVWDTFMEMLQENDPQIAAEWRYYSDGKSWLCKVVQRKTTICWVAVWDKYFSVAAYLNTKAEPLVRASSLPRAVKDSFLQSDKKLRAITIEVRKIPDLEAVRELIGLKMRSK
jgi:hypothetical protein